MATDVALGEPLVQLEKHFSVYVVVVAGATVCVPTKSQFPLAVIVVPEEPGFANTWQPPPFTVFVAPHESVADWPAVTWLGDAVNELMVGAAPVSTCVDGVRKSRAEATDSGVDMLLLLQPTDTSFIWYERPDPDATVYVVLRRNVAIWPGVIRTIFPA